MIALSVETASFYQHIPSEGMMKSTTSLRVCRKCGLEAQTVEDLELFAKGKRSLHGRKTICKKCQNAYNREYHQKTAELVEVFRKRSFGGFIWCYFCHEEITVLEGNEKDSLVIHSIDGDHDNWSPENKAPTHRICHSSYHNTSEKNPRWKGDDASDHAEYMREWRRRKIGRSDF